MTILSSSRSATMNWKVRSKENSEFYKIQLEEEVVSLNQQNERLLEENLRLKNELNNAKRQIALQNERLDCLEIPRQKSQQKKAKEMLQLTDFRSQDNKKFEPHDMSVSE